MMKKSKNRKRVNDKTKRSALGKKAMHKTKTGWKKSYTFKGDDAMHHLLPGSFESNSR